MSSPRKKTVRQRPSLSIALLLLVVVAITSGCAVARGGSIDADLFELDPSENASLLERPTKKQLIGALKNEFYSVQIALEEIQPIDEEAAAQMNETQAGALRNRELSYAHTVHLVNRAINVSESDEHEIASIAEEAKYASINSSRNEGQYEAPSIGIGRKNLIRQGLDATTLEMWTLLGRHDQEDPTLVKACEEAFPTYVELLDELCQAEQNDEEALDDIIKRYREARIPVSEADEKQQLNDWVEVFLRRSR